MGKLISVLYGELQAEGQLQSLHYQLSYDVDINVPALRVCPPTDQPTPLAVFGCNSKFGSPKQAGTGRSSL